MVNAEEGACVYDSVEVDDLGDVMDLKVIALWQVTVKSALVAFVQEGSGQVKVALYMDQDKPSVDEIAGLYRAEVRLLRVPDDVKLNSEYEQRRYVLAQICSTKAEAARIKLSEKPVRNRVRPSLFEGHPLSPDDEQRMLEEANSEHVFVVGY